MHAETLTIPSPRPPTGQWPFQDGRGHAASGPGLHRERRWRETPVLVDDGPVGATILASRWIDERATARVERSAAPFDRYVIGVALRPVRIRVGRGTETAFEGMMPSGMVHVTEPGQALEAEFFGPCDFIHYHVAADVLHDCRAGLGQGGCEDAGPRRLRDLLHRDDLAAQLSRTLTDDAEGGDPAYADSVGRTILMRVLARRPQAARVGTLPKWRLRRVQEYLVANISEPISLADLAEAAGLSRMHFAAQFRVATGCRPHDYLLQQRIERAKQMLADTDTPLVEVALSVGFQTQSHFSTVFRRLAGETPGRWQRTRRGA